LCPDEIAFAIIFGKEQIISSRPAALITLAQTRAPKPRPGKMCTGTPVNKASAAVVVRTVK
jgi:hypothetical protein